MALLNYNKINDWVKYLAEGVNCQSDTFMVALSNVSPQNETNPPTQDGNGKLSNVTEISYTYCSSRTLTLISSSQSGGVYKLKFQNKTISASGGSVGPFRYIYIYDDTHSDKPLVCYFDIGYSYTIEDGEGIELKFDDNGLFVVTSE